MNSRRYAVPVLVGLTLSAAGRSGQDTRILITNATVVDGTGAPAFGADVRVRGDRIAEVGDLTSQPDEIIVDAGGLVLTPGFIDTHSHHDRGIFRRPEALAVVSQGITTIVAGQDGGSSYPLRILFDSLESTPAAVNVASFSGHNTLRRRVMNDDFRRAASDAEVEQMRRLLEEDLEAGALGLSTGLEYDPGIYSETDEVLRLARQAAQAGGRYISHMRSEDRYLWDAVEETIRIGREAELPVQISHMKLAMRSLWGQASRLLARLDDARASGVEISADVYPYEYWQSTMTVLFPERDFDNRETAAFALRELTSPEGMLIAQFAPDTSYVGKTLAEVAEQRGSDPVTVYMDLIAIAQQWEDDTGRSGESIIATSMSPPDIAALIGWSQANISSDGGLAGRHPRGFGAFPRVLRRYVREDGMLSLEEAVRKMSSLAAEHMGIADRGTIRPGAYADLVLLDAETVGDRATPEDPQRVSAGIERVWVNGVTVFANGATTGATPGRVIRRTETH